MTINIGRIGIRRIMSFETGYIGWTPAREFFRRWKIARKAWATRRQRQEKGQLRLL